MVSAVVQLSADSLLTMDGPTSQQLDDIFFALSDATRRAILRELSRGDATVGQLMVPFKLAPSTMTRHLTVLERAGLVRRIKEGRHRRNRLNPEPLWSGQSWIEEVRSLWNQQLDALEELLARERGSDR